MSDFDRNYAATRRFGADRAVAIDAGLRAHMIRVYNYMAAGVAVTGLVAWLTFQLAMTTTSTGALALTPFGQITPALSEGHPGQADVLPRDDLGTEIRSARPW